MHETLTVAIKGYIDNVESTDGGINLKGWCFHANGDRPVLRFVMSNRTVDLNLCPRNDVFIVYSKSVSMESITGFTFIDPKCVDGGLVEFCDSSGVWCPVFNILRTVLHKARFKESLPALIVVDNFYEDPDVVREFALSKTFVPHIKYHKGKRTDETFRSEVLKTRFESLLNKKITNWEKYGVNGCFQTCVEGDEIVYHFDDQTYAGILFLTPNAPVSAGTTLYRSLITGKMKVDGAEEHKAVFARGFLDGTDFEAVDKVGNVYNRLVLFDSKCLHAASLYFGDTLETGRLFQLFFFDLI